MWDPNGDPLGVPKKRSPRRRTKRQADAEVNETFEEMLRRYDLEQSQEPHDEPHPLTLAGPKLKVLRETSGWTVSEIAERTFVPLKVLAAFEKGDSAAAEKLDLSDLERLASACCGSLTDLLGPDVAAVRRALRRWPRSSFDSLF